MKQIDKKMHKVTTARVIGFGAAVRSLGKHLLGDVQVYYTPEHVRMVLQGKQKSVKLLKLIAEKCPAMFDICNVSEDVKAWLAAYKQEVA